MILSSKDIFYMVDKSFAYAGHNWVQRMLTNCWSAKLEILLLREKKWIHIEWQQATSAMWSKIALYFFNFEKSDF